jgi:hypothetical protein
MHVVGPIAFLNCIVRDAMHQAGIHDRCLPCCCRDTVGHTACTAVHPDPLDSYALATYAAATKRTSELMPLEHIDKCREFSGPFAVPGARLFEDFCQDLVHRYCLEGTVVQDKVSGDVQCTACGAAGRLPKSIRDRW